MDEEIEVAPSEENGNIPLEETSETTPSEQPEEISEETEVEEVEEPVEPTEPQEELIELPDGRKVTAEEVAQEYKNLLSDYTKKSQALAAFEENNINKTPEKPYEQPDWQPKDWKEAIQLAKQEALQEIENKEQAKVEQRQALENEVVTQLAEVKKTDPTLNETALFLHANSYREKYGVSFPDLQTAYKHMKDTSELTKRVQKTTADNIAKRNDPVSVSPGATGAKPDPSAFGNAVEYLRSLKG